MIIVNTENTIILNEVENNLNVQYWHLENQFVVWEGFGGLYAKDGNIRLYIMIDLDCLGQLEFKERHEEQSNVFLFFMRIS